MLRCLGGGTRGAANAIFACGVPSLVTVTYMTVEKRLKMLIDGAILISTMDLPRIDLSARTPLYEQVAAEIRRAIADGEAKAGERMPLAKDLATVLGVNTNTVLRALRVLREEGLLEFRRGRGITVAGTPQRGAVLEKVTELVTFARKQGYRSDEVIAMIRAIG
jgi:GntR family transcriptional regulator